MKKLNKLAKLRQDILFFKFASQECSEAQVSILLDDDIFINPKVFFTTVIKPILSSNESRRKNENVIGCIQRSNQELMKAQLNFYRI